MNGQMYGVLVIGPSGSGKSTFVAQLSALLGTINRAHALVNFDPGNESLSYKADIDINELVTVRDIQAELSLG